MKEEKMILLIDEFMDYINNNKITIEANDIAFFKNKIEKVEREKL